MQLESAAALGLAEPEETGTTFAQNAALKAKVAAQTSGMMALADDSGLCVDALDDEPGIYSARWAGADKNFAVAMQKIETLLREKGAHENACARFVVALALATPEGDILQVEGVTHGTLTFPPRGDHGFGYDPIFIPDGATRTFAQMDAAEKASYSHRARAVAALKSQVAA